MKLAPAAVIDPDAIVIGSPTVAMPARRATDLTHKPHAPISICSAGVSAVVGSARNQRGSRVASAATIAGLEIGAATVIDPDRILVFSPTVSTRARRAASLVDHQNAAAGIRRAIVPPAIVGRTVDGPGAAALIHVRVVRSDCEIGPAPMIDPDAILVRSPTVALLAR